MGMYDRDWYREERRQQRQALRESSQQKPLMYAQTVQKGPPSVFSVKALFILGFALIVALITLGFV